MVSSSVLDVNFELLFRYLGKNVQKCYWRIVFGFRGEIWADYRRKSHI